MQLSQLTEKQKQLAIAAVVIVAAVGLGYALGKKPADMTEVKSGESKTGAMVEQAPGATAGAPSTGTSSSGTMPSGTTAPKTGTTSGSEQPIAAPAKTGAISLAGKSGNGGISFNWNLPSNLTSPFGYVIYKSTSSSPSFPRDEAKFVSDPNARSYTWDIQDGKTYWFKMCTWNGKATTQSGCLTTSNVVKVTAPTASAAQQQNPFDYTATELGLAGRGENDGIRLFWSQTTAAGFVSYKIVRSAIDTNPYYPKTPAVLTLTNKTDVGGFDNTATKGAKYWYRVCVVRTGLNPQCGSVWQVQY